MLVVGGEETEACVPQEFSTPAELDEFRVTCQTVVKPAMASHIINKLKLNNYIINKCTIFD